MHPNRSTVRLIASIVFAFTLFSGFGLALHTSVQAADPPNQPFDLIYEAKNVYYRGFQDGLGMLGANEGTLNDVTLNGTQIVKAYLVWAGLGRDDNGVTFARNAETPVAIAPDYVWNNDTFGGSTWGCCGGELSVYAADITAEGIVEIGTNSYTLGDMAITHIDNNQEIEENWGYSLLVIFEDPTLPQPRDIFIKLGNDGLFANWTGLIGPNSDVQCLAFDPSDVSRMANFNVIVGGVENDKRPNALWGLSGNEDYVDANNQGGTWNQSAGLIHLPPNIVGIDGVGGIQLDGPFAGDSTNGGTDLGPPFFDRNGDEWDEYQRFDVEIAPNEDWVCVQVESASQTNRPDLPPVVPESPINENVPASIGFMGFIGIIDSPLAPAIDIVKKTNGQDANDPDGDDVPTITPGGQVIWTYEVTNIGTVDIPEADITVTDTVEGDVTQIIDKGNDDTVLAPNETWIYEVQGTAIDTANPPADQNLTLVPNVCTRDGAISPPSTAYTNIGTVTIPTTSAEDPSSYCNPPETPAIGIVKKTNGQDANLPDGADVPFIAPDSTVIWTYEVTNIGTVDIPEADITVTDTVEGDVTQIIDKGNDDAVLSPDETWIYELQGTAINTANPPAGQNLTLVPNVCTQDGAISPPNTAYTNVGTVTIPTMSATDPSSYCNPPEIDIVKKTNDLDANDPNGTDVPFIAPNNDVIWTYEVTNIGAINIPEADIVVTDSIEGVVTQIINKADGDDILKPGEKWIYQLQGTAINLLSDPPPVGDNLVSGVCTKDGTLSPASTAYTNVGTVTIPSMEASDPSSYCTDPSSGIDEPDAPARPENGGQIFMPLLRR